MLDYRLTSLSEQQAYLEELISEVRAANFLLITEQVLQCLRFANAAPDHQIMQDGSAVYSRKSLIYWLTRKKSRKK